MPRFTYNAYAHDGRLVKGDVDADSDAAALDLLVRRGLTPVSVSSGAKTVRWWARDLSFGNAHLKDQELSRFFSNFAAMIKARFPLMKALDFCREQTSNARLRHSLENISVSVSNGAQLHSAMQEERKLFPPYLISMIKLGEQSNSLPHVLERVDAMLHEQLAIKRELKGALIYPLILLVMAVLVMALIVFYLVPALLPVFSSASAKVPVPLQIMSGLRSFLLEWWPGIGIALVCIVLGFSTFQGHATALLMPILRRLPIIGRFMRQNQTLSFCQTMALMLGSGATLTQSLATVQQTSSSLAMQELFVKAEKRVADGGQMSDVLSGSPLIDPVAVALIDAAEETDSLADTFETIVETLSTRLRETLKQAMQLLTPILTLIIGLIVGAVILTTISAIMDINDIAL